MRTGRPKFSFLYTTSNLRYEIHSRFVELERERGERVGHHLSLSLF